MAKNAILPIEMESFNSAALSGVGTFDALNPDGLDHSVFLLRIINDSDTDILISYDGVVDHDYVPAGDILQVDLQPNTQIGTSTAGIRQGTVVYAEGTAGTGLIYVAGYYRAD